MDALGARISAGGTAAWYLTDRQGSTRLMTNAAGAVQATLTYDGFGAVTSNTNASFTDRFGYAGGEFDSGTGLGLFGWRWYNPLTSRWTSEDLIGFAGGDANLYRYVGNSPTNATDPSGLSEFNKYQEQGFAAIGLDPKEAAQLTAKDLKELLEKHPYLRSTDQGGNQPIPRSVVEKRLELMKKIAKAYGELYKKNPDLFLWAGFAAVAINDGVLPGTMRSLWACGDVYKGEYKLLLDAIEPPRPPAGELPLRDVARDGAKAAFVVNLALFSDLYWAHLAYLEGEKEGEGGGIKKLEELKAPPKILEAFRKIHAGKIAGPQTEKGRKLIVID